MSEMLTMAEIEERYDGEWVLLEDPIIDQNDELVGGKVILHNREREEFDRLSLRHRVSRAAVTYIGEMSDEMAVVL